MANIFDQFDTTATAQPSAPAQPAAPAPEQPGMVMDVGRGVLAGARNALQSVLDLSEDAARAVVPESMITEGSEGLSLPEVSSASTLPGRLVQGVTQFGLAFVPIGRAMGAFAKGASLVRGAAAGAAADFVAFDEAEHRLSNVLVDMDNPLLTNAVTEYLAADPEDGWAEGRFKNVLEGLALGTAAEVLFRGVRSLRGGKGAVTPDDGIEAAVNKLQGEIDGLPPGKAGIEVPDVDAKAATDRARAGLGEEIPVVGLDQAGVAELRRRVGAAKAGDMSWEAALEDLPLGSSGAKLTSDDAKVVIEQLTSEIRKASDGLWDQPQTLGVVRNMADDLGMDPAQVIRNVNQLGSQRDEIAANIIAARGVEQALAKRLPELARAVDEGTLSAADFDAWADVAVASVKGIREAGSALGRGLKAFSVEVDPSSNSLVRDLVADLAVSGDKEAFRRRLASVKNPEGARKLLHQVASGRTWDVLNEFWINALLSGPKTHAVNMASNTISSLIRPLEEGIGSVLVQGSTKGLRRMVGTYAGMVKFAGDSISYAKQALMDGDNILDPQMLPQEVTGRAIPGALGTAVRLPTRALSAADEFFKQINYRSRVYALASEEGVTKGLKGRELAAFIEDQLAKSFDADGLGINEAALQYAQDVTFTNPLGAGTFGHTVQMALQEHPALRQILPFIRTPTNLFRQAYRHMPGIGMFEKHNREVIRRGNPDDMALLIGQQVIGSSILLSAQALALADRITGGGPKDPALRQAWLQEHQPYSIKVGDRWFQFERLDPLGMLFGIVGDWNEIAGEVDEDTADEIGAGTLWALIGDWLKQAPAKAFEEPLSTTWRGVQAAAKNVVSKTYLQSVSDLLETLNSDEEWRWERFMQNRIGSFVPNILRQVNPDPYLREVRDTMDAIMSRIPGLSENVEPRFTFLGKPVMRTGHPVVRTFSPVQTFVEPNHPVYKELNRLGQAFLPASSKQGNVDLTQFKDKRGKTAYYRLNELIQQSGLEGQLTKLIQSPGYAGLSDNRTLDLDQIKYQGSKIGLIQKVVDQHRQIALARLQAEQFTSRTGQGIAQALLSDRINRQAAKAPGTALAPIQ